MSSEWSGTPPALGRRSHLIGLALALALSVDGVVLVTGLIDTNDHGGPGAAIGILGMTLPVAWARRAPPAAAACLGVAAPLNVLAFGTLVRCGPALPAVFYVVACLGLLRRWDGRVGLAAALAAGSLATQAVFDPRLGASVLPMLLVVALAAFGIGRLIARRSADVVMLRRYNAELAEQQTAAAQLSIAIERERVTSEIDTTLRETLEHIATVSTGARASLESPVGAVVAPVDVEAAFADVERSGRSALARMRAVVRELRDTTM